MIVTVGVNRPGPSTAQRPGQMRPRPQATPISRTPKLALPSAVNGAQAANFESMPRRLCRTRRRGRPGPMEPTGEGAHHRDPESALRRPRGPGPAGAS